MASADSRHGTEPVTESAESILNKVRQATALPSVGRASALTHISTAQVGMPVRVPCFVARPIAGLKCSAYQDVYATARIPTCRGGASISPAHRVLPVGTQGCSGQSACVPSHAGKECSHRQLLGLSRALRQGKAATEKEQQAAPPEAWRQRVQHQR